MKTDCFLFSRALIPLYAVVFALMVQKQSLMKRAADQFRAPGVNQTKASTSRAYVDAELRKDSATSFDKATTDLIKDLDTALGDIRTAVKEGRGHVQIAHKPGYAGGGAIDGTTATVVLLVFIIVASLCARRQMGRTGRDPRKRPTKESD